MKNQTINVLGLVPVLAVPETVEEFDTNAKRAGACLDEGIANVIYRSFNADFRAVMCEVVELLFGIKRLTKPVMSGDKPKTQKVKVVKEENGVKVETEVEEEVLQWAESEVKYFMRVCGELDIEDPAESRFNDLGQLLVEGIWDDAGNVQPEQLEKLSSIITDLDGEEDKLDEVVTIIKGGIKFDASAKEKKPTQPKRIPESYLNTADQLIKGGNGEAVAAELSKRLGYTKPISSDRESLAKAIQAFEAKRRAEEQKRLGASMLALVGA